MTPAEKVILEGLSALLTAALYPDSVRATESLLNADNEVKAAIRNWTVRNDR